MKWRSSYTVIIVFLTWAVPLSLAGLWYWLGFLLTVAAVLGIWEAISLHNDKMTLSDRMTLLVRSRPLVGWSIIASMVLGWILLTLVHLPFGI